MLDRGGNTPGVASLKRATREAIEAAGGLDVAQRETRARKSQLGRCQSQHHDDTLSLRDALALDEITLARGGPFILHALARALEHEAVTKCEAMASGEGLAAAVVCLSARLGDVSTCVVEALADGTVTRKERVGIMDALNRMEQFSVGLRMQLVGRDEASQ